MFLVTRKVKIIKRIRELDDNKQLLFRACCDGTSAISGSENIEKVTLMVLKIFHEYAVETSLSAKRRGDLLPAG
jgi:hypothetical protein